MGKNSENIKLSLLIPVALALGVLLASSIIGVYWLGNQNIDLDATARLSGVERIFQWQLKHDTRLMNRFADSIMGDDVLSNAWSRGDNGALSDRANKLFQKIKNEFRLSHFTLYDSNQKCILRVHDPENNGDIVKRYILSRCASTGIPTHGLELSDNGVLALRVVHPRKEQGRIVGFIELGEELCHTTADLTKTLKADLLFTINKSLIDQKKFNTKNNSKCHKRSWDQFSHFVIIDHTMDKLPASLSNHIKFTPTSYGKPIFNIDQGSQSYRGGFLRLRNASNESIGDIVVLLDVTAMKASQIQMAAIIAILSSIIAIILFVLFFIHVHHIERRIAKDRRQLQNEISGKKRTERKLNLAIDRVEQNKEETRQVNRQLKVAVERATNLTQQAKDADVTKSEFLANMSHEIRTPMNAIIGFSDVLAEEELTQKQQGHIDIIRQSSKNLLQLINDILDFSKIEAGKMDTERIKCSLRKLVTGIEMMMAPLAKRKGFEFEVNFSDDLPGIIVTDPVRLQQCFINLVNNAIKFTEKGHVHLNVSLQVTAYKSLIRFDIEDTGIGISPDKQKTIFEAFMQADGAHTRKFGGTGLGLSIAKKLVKLLDGELTVSSEINKGSTFTIVLPPGLDISQQPGINELCEPDRGEYESQSLEQQKFSGNILVAEDTPTNQVLIKLLLEKLGLGVTIVEDGVKAAEQAVNECYDLIFMDMHMPKMSGYDATKTIREKGQLTPIVALTASAMKSDENRCLESGCDDYLTKPINRVALLEILKKYLTAEKR